MTHEVKKVEPVIDNSYWAGFPYEEDIETVIAECSRVFGPQGNMELAGRGITLNAIVSSPKYGILWYGDIETSRYTKGCETISQKFGIPLVVRTQGS